MMKKIIALAAAAAMALSLAACKGGAPKNTGANDNLNGKAYTEQAFDGAIGTGLLSPAVNAAGELVVVSQESGQFAVVSVYGADGKVKSAVDTDVTDAVSLMALGPDDAVYLLAEPADGLETVHVLDAAGKTAKTIALEGMRSSTQQQRVNIPENTAAPSGDETAAAASGTPDASGAPSATATPRANQGNNAGNDEGPVGFNMRSRVTAMAVAPDGSILAASLGSGILVFDGAGKQARTIGEGGMISYMAMNEKGQLVVYAMGGGQGMGRGGDSPALKTYDAATEEEISSVVAAGIASMQAMFYDKAGRRLLFMTDSDVRELAADGKTSTVLATFSDFSLLNGARQMMSIAVDGQGTIYLAAYNSDGASSSGSSSQTVRTGGMVIGGDMAGGMAFTIGGGSANEVIRLGLVDASSIRERKVITMAALNGSRVLDQAISAFQLANPGYKIELKVYNTQVQGMRRAGGGSGGGQFDTGSLTQAFNTDLMSGQGADIIVLDGLPWYKYTDKGLLLDMGQWMRDKGLDASRYYSNVFDACELGGKLYGIPMSFGYSVLTGDAACMPESASPTIAEFVERAKSLPDGIAPFANQDALRTFYSYMQFSYADVVDTQNRKARFDSPEFIQAMKDFKDLLGENASTNTNQEFQFEQFRGNVAYNITPMSAPMNFATQKAVIEANGGTMKHTNVPTLTGSGGKAFTASLLLGINADSKNKDAAWEFIQTMLGEDIQGSGRLSGYPVLKSAAEAMIADMMEGATLGAGGRRMVLRIGDGGASIEIKPLTQEDAQAIRDALSGLNALQAVDPNVQQVLNEELPTFFSGQKSAEEVAGLIQNRVNTILNE